MHEAFLAVSLAFALVAIAVMAISAFVAVGIWIGDIIIRKL